MRSENQIAASVLARLRLHYPDVFRPTGMRRIPLASDIKRQIWQAGFPAARFAINVAVKRYQRDPEYLRALFPGSVKIGLDGLPAGRVTMEEAAQAAARLARRAAA